MAAETVGPLPLVYVMTWGGKKSGKSAAKNAKKILKFCSDWCGEERGD